MHYYLQCAGREVVVVVVVVVVIVGFSSIEFAAMNKRDKHCPYLDNIDVVVSYCAIVTYFFILLCRGRRRNGRCGSVAL